MDSLCEIRLRARGGFISFHIATTEQYFTIFARKLFHIRRKSNISLERIMKLWYNNAKKGGGEMEILLEYFITVWFELALKLVPDSKKSSKKVLFLCKLISILVLLYQVAAFTAGPIIFSNSTGLEILGVVLLSSSVIIFVSQIILGIIFYSKKK